MMESTQRSEHKDELEIFFTGAVACVCMICSAFLDHKLRPFHIWSAYDAHPTLPVRVRVLEYPSTEIIAPLKNIFS